ncbi:MAG: hypothetical protein NDJ90_14495, partial [Oligoflexia bacterium]|nr:hypothetical protein [Oligoflexia bacterium]
EKRRVAAFIHRKPNLDDPLDIGTLKKAIDLLHKNNSVILPGDRSFSFGCIQVVNVSHCQQITLKLTELAAQSKGNDDLDFRVICLHGRLSLAVRNWLDRQMNPMLCRKGPSGDLAPLSNPFVREFVAGSACRDTAIVLVSTMETTGRDHDFDWGIIESRQERDIIQFAGRIRRHRPPGDQVKNLIVWDAPLRWKGAPWKPRDPTDNPDAFQFFGVGDRIGKDLKQVVLRRTHQHPKYGLMPSYQEMLESTYGKAPLITPSRILTETSPPASDYDAKTGFASTVRACETARLRSTLLECRPHKCHTLAEWLTDHNKIHRLLCKHQDQYRFRSGRPMELYWRDEDGAWYYVVEPGRELESSVKQPEVPDISVANNGFLFSSLDEDVEIFEIQEKTSSFHRKDRIRLSGVYFTEPPSGDPTRLRYHPQIGLYAGSGR